MYANLIYNYCHYYHRDLSAQHIVPNQALMESNYQFEISEQLGFIPLPSTGVDCSNEFTVVQSSRLQTSALYYRLVRDYVPRLYSWQKKFRYYPYVNLTSVCEVGLVFFPTGQLCLVIRDGYRLCPATADELVLDPISSLLVIKARGWLALRSIKSLMPAK